MSASLLCTRPEEIHQRLTELQSSFNLVQARFPLGFVAKAPTNGWEHFGLPSLYKQGVVVLLNSQTHANT